MRVKGQDPRTWRMRRCDHVFLDSQRAGMWVMEERGKLVSAKVLP